MDMITNCIRAKRFTRTATTNESTAKHNRPNPQPMKTNHMQTHNHLRTPMAIAAAMTALALTATSAHAALVNAGFNDDGTQVATPTGWTLDGTFVGTRTGVGALTPTEGTHQMWLNVGTLYQDTGVTIELGSTYTLTVDLGLTAGVGDGHTGTYRLYGSTLGHTAAIAGAEGSAVPVVDVWNLDETVSFVATAD